MRPPRIKSVETKDDHFLVVEFENTTKKLYDVAPLFDREMFAPLKNPIFFRAAKVDSGGYAVYWNEDIDLSENELWTKGKIVNV
jgi:hypothetical protein